MDLKALREKYEEELNLLNKEIGEKVIKAERLQAKLNVLDDIEADVEEKAESVENNTEEAVEDTETKPLEETLY